MTTLLDTMKQALEALELLQATYHTGIANAEINNLRTAIEQAEKVEDEVAYWKQMHAQDVNTLKEELREAEKAQDFCFACGVELSEQAEKVDAERNEDDRTN